MAKALLSARGPRGGLRAAPAHREGSSRVTGLKAEALGGWRCARGPPPLDVAAGVAEGRAAPWLFIYLLIPGASLISASVNLAFKEGTYFSPGADLCVF